MNGTEERPLTAQLTTALALIGQFQMQIAEWEGMGAKRRARTVRGRDLAARIGGLREGHATWVARAERLRVRIAESVQAEDQSAG